jgi:organic hydroperoxide reductase OsmC/OhrA
MATNKSHDYSLALAWEGNLGTGTASYDAYGRSFRVRIEGKPDLVGSADPLFRGDASIHNPEDLLLAAVSSCHMLSYLALCARKRIAVLSYDDAATGTMVLTPDGGGHFTEVTLRPRVTLAVGADVDEATRLHERAHAVCFIASSCNFPIHCRPEVRHA